MSFIARLCLGLAVVFSLGTFCPAVAGTAEERIYEIKQCVADNDPGFCRTLLTRDSYPIFDRFTGYDLIPCLPSNLRYHSEHRLNRAQIQVDATLRRQNKDFLLHLIYEKTGPGLKLSLPATLARGFGPNWQNKIDLAEQLYLVLRAQNPSNTSCNMLTGLMQ